MGILVQKYSGRINWPVRPGLTKFEKLNHNDCNSWPLNLLEEQRVHQQSRGKILAKEKMRKREMLSSLNELVNLENKGKC